MGYNITTDTKIKDKNALQREAMSPG